MKTVGAGLVPARIVREDDILINALKNSRMKRGGQGQALPLQNTSLEETDDSKVISLFLFFV
jgi:hypothetical protein